MTGNFLNISQLPKEDPFPLI